MSLIITCKCGSENLTEIPSGEDSKAYECGDCGTTILTQFIKPEEESKRA